MRRVLAFPPAVLLAATLLAVAWGSHAADAPREFRDCADCPEMVVLPAGKFVMGSLPTEAGRFDNEGPRRFIEMPGFALGKYPVTVAEFRRFLEDTNYQPPACDEKMGLSWRAGGEGLVYPPGGLVPPRWPAFCLNWEDARAYVAWLNAKLRKPGTSPGPGPYRLPSEAEWEYAARAGSVTARWWGEGIGKNNANCNGCGSQWDGVRIAPVGSFGPNPFGLYDMLGNVWEWTADCWHDSYMGAPKDAAAWISPDCRKRALRGGSWSNVPAFVRSAARTGADANGQDFDYANYAGFRVARAVP